MKLLFMVEIPGVTAAAATAPAVAVAVAGHGRPAGGQLQEAEEGQE